LVFEYAAGGSLEEYLHKHRHSSFNEAATISEDIAIQLMIELANGLVQTHKLDIAHGDIKADNILLMSKPKRMAGNRDDALIKYADFGGACFDVFASG
jgi:serine/threonine protein kinase